VKAEEEKMVSEKEISQTSQATTSEQKDTKVPSKTSTSSNREQDLDVFLLGDLGSDDEGPGMIFIFLHLIRLIVITKCTLCMTIFWLLFTDDGDDDDGLDDDFDKIDSATVSTASFFRTNTVTGHNLQDVFIFSVNKM
jgi:hypothetical protein